MTKIKLTYLQIRTAMPVLKSLKNKPINGATAPLAVIRQGRILGGHAADSEEMRVGLMQKHSEKDGKGEPIKVPIMDSDGNPTKNMKYKVLDEEPLNLEWTEVLMQEVEVEIPLLPISDLDKSPLELTPEEMEALEPVLKE